MQKIKGQSNDNVATDVTERKVKEQKKNFEQPLWENSPGSIEPTQRQP